MAVVIFGEHVVCIFFFHLLLEITCPYFQIPDNGSISTEIVVVETVVTFQCNLGYELSADSALECNSSGQWNQTVPDCSGEH